MHTWLFFNEKVSIVPASWPIIERLWIGATQGERAWTLSTKNCWEVFLWRRFATMQFAHVNTWANWVATLVTTKFSFMFRSKAQLSPHWRSKQLLTTLIRWHKASIDFQRKNNSCLSCQYPYYHAKKTKCGSVSQVEQYYHPQIQNEVRLKNPIKCHHIPFSVVNVLLW